MATDKKDKDLDDLKMPKPDKDKGDKKKDDEEEGDTEKKDETTPMPAGGHQQGHRRCLNVVPADLLELIEEIEKSGG